MAYFSQPRNATRLIWCTLHPRRSMALSEVYGLPRELCLKEGGACKQVLHGEWVHLLCAIWIFETSCKRDFHGTCLCSSSVSFKIFFFYFLFFIFILGIEMRYL